jgi:hypothetical protein
MVTISFSLIVTVGMVLDYNYFIVLFSLRVRFDGSKFDETQAQNKHGSTKGGRPIIKEIH